MSPSSPLDHPRVLEWGMMTELLRVLCLCPLEIQVGGLHEQETSVCFLLEKSKPPLMGKMEKEQSRAENCTCTVWWGKRGWVSVDQEEAMEGAGLQASCWDPHKQANHHSRGSQWLRGCGLFH